MTDRKDRLRLADMIDRIDKACGTLAQQRAIATEGATWLELVDAHREASAMAMLIASVFADRLVALGASRSGLDKCRPVVDLRATWCIALRNGAPYLAHSRRPEDVEFWRISRVCLDVPEELRVQTLGDLTLVWSNHNDACLLSTSLRVDSPPDTLRAFMQAHRSRRETDVVVESLP